jgi:hypothetical protein
MERAEVAVGDSEPWWGEEQQPRPVELKVCGVHRGQGEGGMYRKRPVAQDRRRSSQSCAAISLHVVGRSIAHPRLNVRSSARHAAAQRERG